jgi:transcriptional regulator with XRE-family HTH domain
MGNQSLGETIRTLREKADISLRELAKRVDVSAPFMSDVELGRRYPGEPVLEQIAKHLKIDVEELKKHDPRESVADFKRLLETSPALGLAFRTAVTDVKSGKMTAEDLAKKLRGGSR